jgi:hypothetical protein
MDFTWVYTLHSRAVGRSENPGVPVLFSGNKLPPLVEIGLTNLPKFGGVMAPPGTTGLHRVYADFAELMQWGFTIDVFYCDQKTVHAVL